MTALAVLALALAGGCAQEKLSPEAERGRQIYQAQCIACHNTDPAQPGATRAVTIVGSSGKRGMLVAPKISSWPTTA